MAYKIFGGFQKFLKEKIGSFSAIKAAVFFSVSAVVGSSWNWTWLTDFFESLPTIIDSFGGILDSVGNLGGNIMNMVQGLLPVIVTVIFVMGIVKFGTKILDEVGKGVTNIFKWFG